MKKSNYIRILILVLFGLCSGLQLKAYDYYVSPAGSGLKDGSSVQNAAGFDQLHPFLINYYVSDDKELNIYFAGGTYYTNGVLTFGSASSVSGLKITFAPVDMNNTVIIDGSNSSDIRFAATVGKGSYLPMTLYIRNLTIQNFSSTANNEYGLSSLFTINDYTTLHLDWVHIKNIFGYRNPLVAVNTGGTFRVENSGIINVMNIGSDGYAVFETGASNTRLYFYNSVLDSWSTTAKGSWSYMFWLENDRSELILERTILSKNKTYRSLIASNKSTNRIYLNTSTFRQNEIEHTGVILYAEQAENLTVEDCTFEGNKSSKSIPLIRITGACPFTISGSAFSNNTLLTSSTEAAIIYVRNTTSAEGLVYNNTFSENTVNATSQAISWGKKAGGIFNNTFYNSMGINAVEASPVQNNLMMGTGTVSGNTTEAFRNVYNGNYYLNTSSPVAIPDINQYFDTQLSFNPMNPGKAKIHKLKFYNGVCGLLKLGEEPSLTGYEDLLKTDQRGILRPSRISVGSWDIRSVYLKPITFVYEYDPEKGLIDKELDLSDLEYPEGITKENVTFTILGVPTNGTLTPQVKPYLLKFRPFSDDQNPTLPAPGIVGGPVSVVNYKISYYDPFDEVIVEETAPLTIRVVGKEPPLGSVEGGDIECYDEMETVDFIPRYKYISGSVNNAAIDGYGSNFPNTGNHRFYGFSIPLVGDLDGDGKPEIVALGIRDTEAGLAATASYIYILNGQTGKIIVKYPLPMNWSLLGNYYHDSPASIALIDADRNGKAEIIVATGYNASFPTYSKRLISYEVNENTFLDREGGSDAQNANKLTQKWISDVRYDAYGSANSNFFNAGNFAKPIPQIADIDADGIPEVVVYNKIYNAVTGQLLLKLEDLSTASNSSSANVGQDRLSVTGDNDHGFSYIYDLDLDGKYDIAAGNKVYYDIDTKTGSYKVKSIRGLGDGHTAVADINADGIPEIIVSGFAVNRYNYRITVWDPGFLKKDNSGKIISVNTVASVMAVRDFSCDPGGHAGNHSYIYVGDIDGKKQNGKTFPEISILGPHFFLTGGMNAANVPVHPNVTDGFLKSNFTYSSGSEGALVSFSWDDNALQPEDRLKVSFLMEHKDNSINTGFTLFDFDNNRVQDICYRDEHTLRIISAQKSFISLNEGDPEIIRFNKPIRSYTGFEYPVIADIDGDGSADMIVMGYSIAGGNVFSYIYAVESGGAKFAPAPKVWNQFMYSPLKIKEDLTTPQRTLHPLEDDFGFYLNPNDENKTYIYNNTLTQTLVYSRHETENSSGEKVTVIRPIVVVPDGAVVSASMEESFGIRLVITNVGDATLNAATPIAIYLEEPGVSQYENGILKKGLFKTIPVGTDLFPGEIKVIDYPLSANERYDMYVIRISDASTSVDGVFTDLFGKENAPTQFKDCNWANNVIRVGSRVVNDDAATVVRYGTVMIDVFANDVLPPSCGILEVIDIFTPEGHGVMKGSFGEVNVINDKLLYTAPGNWEEGVVKLTYRVRCGVPGAERRGDVYIFILQSEEPGFAGCYGSPYEVRLKEIPEGVTFNWYDENKQYIPEVPSVSSLTEDLKFYVKPFVPRLYVDFPEAEITVKVLSEAHSNTVAVWKGVVDTNWHNPRNWVELKNGKEVPVSWIPDKCVDVVLAENAPYYPVINSQAACRNITLKDRSMLAGIHWLDYEEASVELKWTEKEKDRFIMWSAPLRRTYTGDYHFRDNGTVIHGDVYMNFFQSKNPDYAQSVATELTFTSTFANMSAPLPLGKAFNIKVVSSRNPNSVFVFPSPVDRYTYVTGDQTPLLDRTDGAGRKINGRFIVEEVTANPATGMINLPVEGMNDYRMMQVVNPYPAYLDMVKFLDTNSATIERGYKIWDGSLTGGFVSVILPEDSEDQRLVIVNEVPEDIESGGDLAALTQVAPFQSFFVLKRNKTDRISSLVITPEMTATVSVSNQPNYELRKGSKPELIRIRAGKDNFSNTVALYYSKSGRTEDMHKLFREESPVSIYMLNPANEAFAIRGIGHFSERIPLGLRLNAPGKITLEFEEVAGFGREVYLIDKKENRVINLNRQSSYTFQAERPAPGAGMFEVNDRFSLSFENSTTGTELPENGDITVSVIGNVIRVTSSGEEIENVHVYNLGGMLVYKNDSPSFEYNITVSSQQFYIVKVLTDKEEKSIKIPVF